MPTSRRSPIQLWCDVFVFAPLGFALEARELVPKLIHRGRQHVDMARIIGRVAVARGQEKVGEVVKRGRNGSSPGAAPSAASSPRADTEPPTDRWVWDHDHAGEHDGEHDDEIERPIPVRHEGADIPFARAEAADAGLAIPDYDSLSASQVVPRLAALDESELEAVRRYELAHRARRTILGRVAQLQNE